MGIKGIEHLKGEDDFDQSDVESKTGDERETTCQEWWKAPRKETSGEEIVDHNHICTLAIDHEPPCVCNCGESRPMEDHD